MHGDRSTIDRQLRGVRRRLNALELQNALYRFATVTFLLASLMVILALRATSKIFAVALWATLGFTMLGLVFATLHVHRRWFTLHRAALFADRRAKLEDRLATLITLPAPPPTFAALLSRDVAALAPRWAPKVLVPHAVPRSLALLAASILLFTATLFVERKPEAPIQTSLRSILPTAAVRQAPPTPEKQSLSQQSETLGSANQEASPGEGTMEQTGGGLSSPGLGAIVSGEGFQKSAPLSASRREKPFDSFSPPLPPDAIAQRVQSLLRTALGASATLPHYGEDGEQPRLSRQTTDQPSGTEQRANGGQKQPSANEEKKEREQRRHADAGGNHSPSGPGRSQRASGAPGSGGAGLFGKPEHSPKGTAKLTRFEVQLTGSSQPVRYQMEPQAQPRGNKVAAGIAASSSTIAPLSAEDIADAPLHRTEIAPEMESLVGQIFTTRANP